MRPLLVCIFVLVLLYAAFAAGIFYQAQKDSTALTSAKKVLTEINPLNVGISVSGQVKSIAGNTITITNQSGTVVSFPVQQSVKVLDISPTGLQQTTFPAVNAGDKVGLSIVPSAQGVLEVYEMTVTPQTGQ